MIQVEDLCFTYAGATEPTLKDLRFNIANGEIMGFLGPSGAGKSTTQNILIGLLRDYQGSVEVMGREIRQWKQDYYQDVGVCFELPNHYLKLTARENLDYFRGMYRGPTEPVMTVLDWVGLSEHADQRVSEFSKGMKNRLNLARSLIHQPKLLFLDEPTTGLDPVNARKVKDLVLEMKNRGTTIFVTTHNMMVADQLCDRVAFMTNGSLRVVDRPETLKKQHGVRQVRVNYRDQQGVAHEFDFELDGLGDNTSFVSLLKEAHHLETIHSQETTLEQIFIDVTGEALEP